MKQKFLLLKSQDHKELIIKELAELDTGKFSVVCQEKHPSDVIKKSLDNPGKLMDVLRSDNMFPPSHVMDRMIESICEMFESNGKESVELIFDDMELIENSGESVFIMEEPVVAEVASIDELLEEEIADDFIGDIDVKSDDPIDTSIDQISIDDTLADEED